MVFQEQEVAEAILKNTKDKCEIRLEKVDFYYGSKKLLMDIASKGSVKTKQGYNEVIIDELTISKSIDERFSLGEPYSIEGIMLLKDYTDMYAYRFKIPNVCLQFMETDLMKIKYYIESDNKYITYKKLKFSCLHISIKRLSE